MDVKSFDYQYNSKIIKNTTNPANMLNISSYMELQRFNNNRMYSPLHMPNENLTKFLLNIPTSVNSNVNQNATAILLPAEITDTVKRQYMSLGRNPAVDAIDPYVATLRDMANTGYVILKNPQYKISLQDYFITANLVYARNKMMCLYDTPINK